MVIENRLLPDFIKKYIRVDELNLSMENDWANSSIIIHNEYVDNNGLSRMNIMSKIYLLAKEKLELQFAEVDFCGSISIKTESEFLNHKVKDVLYFTIPILFDMPVYWYNNKTQEIGKSLLRHGCRISFSSINTFGGSPPVVIYISYFHNFFSDYITSNTSYGTSNPLLYYFAPASKINRLILRNLALEVKVKYPEFSIEFETLNKSLNHDEYGFID
jgi:hypothetical protein